MTTFSKEPLSHLQRVEEEEEGQWKNLPTDILSLILRRFHTKSDLCRFRSICKSWRSFATPIQPHLIFPLILPPLQPGARSFSLSPQFFYIFSPNSTLNLHNTNECWLTKIAESPHNNNDDDDNKWLVLHPVTNRKLYSQFPRVCRNGLNLLGFRSHEVGRSYGHRLLLDDDDFITLRELQSSYALRKVVVLTEERVSVFGLNGNYEIVLWNHGDENWKIIGTGSKKSKYVFDDIICYDGKFYAVDRTARLIINPWDMDVAEIISSKKGCYNIQRSYIVESDFRLYMVTKIVDIVLRFDDGVQDDREEWIVDFLKSTVKEPLKFGVYVLNEREKRWEEVDSLGNKVFFVSHDTIFSACASDLGMSKGNSIYFEVSTSIEDSYVSVYTLEDEAIVTCDSPMDHRTTIFGPSMTWFVQNEEYPECNMQD